MKKIIPELEVFFDDLVDLSVADFLLSRDFNLFLTRVGEKVTWEKLLQETNTHRGYFSTISDHKSLDSLKVFSLYLNAAKDNEEVESLVIDILIKL